MLESFLVSLAASLLATYLLLRFNVFRRLKELSGALPSWELLFEHDENGKQLSGSIELLMNAAKLAYPVKIRVADQDNFKVINAQILHVYDSGIVHATNIDEVSLGPDTERNLKYFEKPYHYFIILSTKGNLHATRIFFDGSPHYQDTKQRSMAWYALVPPSKWA